MNIDAHAREVAAEARRLRLVSRVARALGDSGSGSDDAEWDEFCRAAADIIARELTQLDGADTSRAAVLRRGGELLGSLIGTRAEQAVEQPVQDNWSVVFDNAPIGMAVMDRTWVIAAVNAAACEVLGRSADQLIGRSRLDFCHPGDLTAARAFIAEVEAGRAERSTLVERAVRPDGTTRWIRAARVVVRDAHGDPESYYSQAVDITDQYQAEAVAERFAAVVQSSPDFIGFTDLDGKTIFINQAGRDMIHFPADVDVTTTRDSDFTIGDPPAEQDHSRQRGSREMTSDLRDWADGSAIPVYASTFIVHDVHTDEPIAVASIRRDMREQLAARRRLEQTLEQRSQLLTELLAAEQNERERIADDIHDESVQLLAAAQLRMQLLSSHLKHGNTEGVLRAAADVSGLIVTSLQQLRLLLADLQPPEAHALSLADSVQHTADQLFAGTDVHVTVEGDMSDLPHDVLAVLSRGAREALSNARRHARATSVTVRFTTSAEHWTVDIEDDGVGVPPEIPRRAGHLGMRAMTSRVEALGGTCTVTARVGGGTRVELAVPRSHGTAPSQ